MSVRGGMPNADLSTQNAFKGLDGRVDLLNTAVKDLQSGSFFTGTITIPAGSTTSVTITTDKYGRIIKVTNG